MVMDGRQYKSPTHKVIAFLKNGRDGWRDKYMNVKTQLRSTEKQLWAVSDSRRTWRERAEAAEAELKKSGVSRHFKSSKTCQQ